MLERRIRTQIRAKEHQFAAVVPRELVGVCRREMEQLGLNILEESEAGVEFRGKLEACYRANLWLRTASRVLCRLPAMKVGAREELFAKTTRLPWELWLDPHVPVRVDVFLSASRLAHTEWARKAFQDAMRKRFEGVGAGISFVEPAPSNEPAVAEEEAAGQRIVVRIEHNRCRISLDTSGAHLHYRGYRVKHVGAPLRETLAAALVLQSGWKPPEPFLDGMCGSGTAVIEAALLGGKIPPGRRRRFLFQRWPSFQEKTWQYLLKKADQGVQKVAPARFIAVDRDPKAVAVARENAVRAGVAPWVAWHTMPFEKLDPRDLGLPPGLVFLNPPYGVRLPADRGLYARLLHHLGRCFAGWKAIVLAPERDLLVSGLVRPRKVKRLRHGGLSITAGFYDF
uniref:N6-adenine-specific DNA methylase n=1 Tax=Desulfacinum infernum TaxID=35837 RepID=A0A832A5R2_9BACT